jgi:hypothetical protein
MDKKELAQILEATPDMLNAKHIEFASYITMIGRKAKTADGWQQVDTPYMNVDGRLAMACADHLKSGMTLDIMPAQVLVNDDRELTLQVTIVSSIYGQRSGTATSYRGGGGIEAQHPWEIAETSAIGRALATMGYGLLPGSGLASAEDMQRALADDEPRPPRGRKAGGDKPASDDTPVDYDGLRQYIVKQGWPGPQQSDFVDLAKAKKWTRGDITRNFTIWHLKWQENADAMEKELEAELQAAKGE